MYVNVINAKKQAITANKFEVWVPITSPKTPTDEDLPVINGKVIDNRIAAPFSNVNEMVNNIGYLEMYFPNLSPATRRGTAVILDACRYSNKYKCNIQYALTAAHNVLDISRMNELKTDADWIDFAIRRNIENNKSKITHLFEVLTNEDEDNPDVYIYPKYNDDPSDSSGYDIALIQIKDPDNILKNMKHIPIKNINSKYTNIAKVIGYPGCIKHTTQTHWMYGMCGKFTIKKDSKIIKYNDIHTSRGQSGGPIFGITKDINDTNNIYNNWSNVNIIGIHTGGIPSSNWGTNINKNIIDWMLSKIPNECKGTIFTNSVQQKKEHKIELHCNEYIHMKWNESEQKREKILFEIQNTNNIFKNIKSIKVTVNASDQNWGKTRHDPISLNFKPANSKDIKRVLHYIDHNLYPGFHDYNTILTPEMDPNLFNLIKQSNMIQIKCYCVPYHGWEMKVRNATIIVLYDQ